MIQTSEYCAVGHPDRTCDYIASFLLDRWIEKDIFARVALEVQLKDNFCTVSGEVSSSYRFTNTEIADFCRAAVSKIGYTRTYQNDFGTENAICADDLEVTVHISQQSGDIAQGVDSDGWGDQGIFWGLAVDSPFTGDMPLDYYLARKVAQEIVSHDIGGLDVKTQVTVRDGKPVECVVAVPLTEWMPIEAIEKTVRDSVGDDCKVIINGTGRYVKHGPVGDCGTTGRKLVVDFYGGNSRIGGGSPWGKDPTKADVTLNIYARKKALDYLREHNLDLVQCAISCCIGRKEITVSFFDKENRLLETAEESDPPSHIIEALGLRYPGYADRCAAGLFGYE
ncbi:MAG: methionine adenosyltransferase domain-containing protein [Kiritimatiellia bacterium]